MDEYDEDLFLLEPPAAEGRVHVKAKKKPSSVFMRLLRKSKVRPEPWTPDFCTSGKSSIFPQRSIGTGAPVAVN